MQLDLQQISKTYSNGTRALSELSLSIGTGMFGLLGPNGAGKSTLMRTIATLQQPDTGSMRFGDVDLLNDPMTLRKTLGYLPQEFGVYPRISAERLLDYLASLKGISAKKERRNIINYCLEVTNLTDVRHTSVSSYSGGMKQRFGIAQLLLNNPKLIIVDEPTAGLDPTERQRFLNILRAISTESIVIFSTHIVEDIKDLCTDMAVLNQGQLLLHTTPEAAIENLEGKIWTTNISATELPDYQRRYTVLSSAYNRDNSLRIRVLTDIGMPEFRVVSPTLEDVYFAALQRSLTLPLQASR
ncbi:ABC transporter ATP-binding protein [Neolewinella persica]|uniref:ABC transporter ATP-binding protein n=1 Tax=Neolewinella persica TaxID=70998 RepID=UPI0003A1F4F5|nr:ABC transporter ATP-binding protein [Neolewinella persica]